VIIPAVILAAGESRRMGSPKALLDLEGETFLDRLIRVLGACCAPVVVVLGHEADAIRSGVRRKAGTGWIINHDYPLGQLSSLQAGFRAIPPGSPYALFTLVDHPAVAEASVRALVDAPDAPVVIASCGGRRGHPVRVRGDVIGKVLALPPDSQAKTLLRENAVCLETGDPGVVEDIDDPEAYRQLRLRLAGGAGR
jgi:CTP:molybdopterin cytidylyltransferase MocA